MTVRSLNGGRYGPVAMKAPGIQDSGERKLAAKVEMVVHIVQEGRQAKISLCEASSYKLHPLAFAKHNIVLAGAWVESTHTLADGAVESGQNAGRLISKMQG